MDGGLLVPLAFLPPFLLAARSALFSLYPFRDTRGRRQLHYTEKQRESLPLAPPVKVLPR